MLWRWWHRVRPIGILAASLRPGSIEFSWEYRPGWWPSATNSARYLVDLRSCTGGTSATTRLS
eukprot:3443859-Pyramimonas_sp.AAC.1